MTGIPPLTFRYIDGHMVPRSRAQADRYYAEGELYALEETHARSDATHRHFFATLHDAWLNLPETMAPQYQTPEHFRKRLLIQAGYCDEQQIVFATENDAVKAASLVLGRDDYCVTNVEGRTLTIWTAKSQSVRAMGAKDFQASKTAVLELAASLIGTTPETLTQNAGQAA